MPQFLPRLVPSPFRATPPSLCSATAAASNQNTADSTSNSVIVLNPRAISLLPRDSTNDPYVAVTDDPDVVDQRTALEISHDVPIGGVLDRGSLNPTNIDEIAGLLTRHRAGLNVFDNELSAKTIAANRKQFRHMFSSTITELAFRMRHRVPFVEGSRGKDVRVERQEILRRRLRPLDVVPLHRRRPRRLRPRSRTGRR